MFAMVKKERKREALGQTEQADGLEPVFAALRELQRVEAEERAERLVLTPQE